jgi:Protein of unknown function (DUF2726)
LVVGGPASGAQLNRNSSETLSETPWPVAARKLLTAREQSLYESLLGLYPDQKIFIQVALSQLVDVPEDHPERQSIRNRFSQLVLDFVLCRADLTVVAVIELDDRSHRRPERQAADARKTKALADAGIRLVRVPAGALPSNDTLREIIDADKAAGNRSSAPKIHSITADPGLRLAEDWGHVETETPRVDHDLAASLAIRAAALKVVLAAVVLVGGWLAYTQLMPVVIRAALQPLASPHVRSESPAPSIPRKPMAYQAPAMITSAPLTPAQEVAVRKHAESQAAADLQRRKDRAWLAHYSPPASCEHPVDWKAQVECGNQYMRVKKEFDKRWTVEHPSGGSDGGAVVLDNESIGGVRK